MLNKKIFLLLSLAAYATCSGHGEHSEKEKSSTAGTSGVISEDKSVDTPGEIKEPYSFVTLIPYLDEMTAIQWDELSTSTEYNTDKSTERIQGQILKPSTNVNINLDDEQWERTFELYNKDGLIGPKELQELIFIEFNGFLFINQAETCIKLINSNGINKLELEQLKKITPILYCLTKEEIFERYKKVNNVHHTFNLTFLNYINDKMDAMKFFFVRKEILKLFKRHGQTEIGPIEKDKINKMLFGSYMVAIFLEIFCTIDEDKDGRVNAIDVVKAVYDFDSETASKKLGPEELARDIFSTGDLNGMCFYEFMVAMVRDIQKAQDKINTDTR